MYNVHKPSKISKHGWSDIDVKYFTYQYNIPHRNSDQKFKTPPLLTFVILRWCLLSYLADYFLLRSITWLSKCSFFKELLESDTSMLTEEKERLLKEMRHKEAMLAREKQEKEKLMSKIMEMESKLLTGL